MKKIIVCICSLLSFIYLPSVYADDFIQIKTDFIELYSLDTYNYINTTLHKIDRNKLGSLKNLIEEKYLPSIEEGLFSKKLSTGIQYIYFKLQDIYVDPNEVQLEDIQSKRELVQQLTYNDTTIYFFEAIDTWSEGTACGGVYDGSNTCYLYVEKDSKLDYVGNFQYGITPTSNISFDGNNIMFNAGFGDALTSISYEVDINIQTQEIHVIATRKDHDPDNLDAPKIEITETREQIEQ